MPHNTVLITGVGRSVGIGRGIAVELARQGWDIAFSYWGAYDRRLDLGGTDDDPRSIERELTALGVRVFAAEGDLADVTIPSALFDSVEAALGPVGALVLSHAESVDSGILTTTVDSFDRHFAVNTRASWLLIAEFARRLEAQGGAEGRGAATPAGRIVALTSDHTVHNLPYGASKGALDRIVIAAARELAHLGITANVVNPGPVDTGWMDDGVRAALLARQPTGRLGVPQDTADLVAFLLSDRGGWISGQLIKSDGGFSI
ncbi:MAG: hypothetical protein RI885_371 [Actinomycetota bacterium]|jgi:3-oxoacyl-[acyl-carrier protein] reductase